MPIDRLLDGSFGRQDIVRLNLAFNAILRALDLVDRDDSVTEIIGKKVIEIDRAGLHDPRQICARAIKELGLP